jgi:tRNA(Leu) C34 or U34 (ribose-2'-O)-methylase TrmL
MGYLHTFYFCVDKKEFDKEGNNYLEDLQLSLSEEIEKQIEKIEKEKRKKMKNLKD